MLLLYTAIACTDARAGFPYYVEHPEPPICRAAVVVDSSVIDGSFRELGQVFFDHDYNSAEVATEAARFGATHIAVIQQTRRFAGWTFGEMHAFFKLYRAELSSVPERLRCH